MDGTSERERLLGLVVDLILREGVIDLSLSAVARGIGSNNRMLLYYFGSKEDLLDEASVLAFERFPKLRDMFARLERAGDLEEGLLEAWDDLSAPENHSFLRLYFQRFGIAMRDAEQWTTFIERAGRQWVGLTRAVFVRAGYSDADSVIAATQIIALWRGLQFLLLTGVAADQLDAAHAAGIRALLAELTPPDAASRRSAAELAPR
ncbi:TetR/AcrR family transcriptional regulator [Planctomonas psychrotolerans]|uniref:TetR/AcrR family transcriptional regulator n=1 Tax=Planctomonas psychrotolerans TaxID=2528712 RepID=UPI001D0CF119|nr:TetR/AcrR family transcriptional regulator [Planctomonas psychrotolerans]